MRTENPDQHSTDAPESTTLPIDTISVVGFAEIFNSLPHDVNKRKVPFSTKHVGPTEPGDLSSLYNRGEHLIKAPKKKEELTGAARVVNTIHHLLRSYALQVGLLFDEEQLPENVRTILSAIEKNQKKHQDTMAREDDECEEDIEIIKRKNDALVKALRKELGKIGEISITLGKGEEAYTLTMPNNPVLVDADSLASIFITLRRAPTHFVDRYKTPGSLSDFYTQHIGFAGSIIKKIHALRAEIKQNLEKQVDPQKAQHIMHNGFPDMERGSIKKLLIQETRSLQFTALCDTHSKNIGSIDAILNLIGKKVEVPKIETIVEMAIVINMAGIAAQEKKPISPTDKVAQSDLLKTVGKLGDIPLTDQSAESALYTYLQNPGIRDRLIEIFEEAERMKNFEEPKMLETLLVQAISRLEETDRFTAIRTEVDKNGRKESKSGGHPPPLGK